MNQINSIINESTLPVRTDLFTLVIATLTIIHQITAGINSGTLGMNYLFLFQAPGVNADHMPKQKSAVMATIIFLGCLKAQCI